MSRVVIYHHPSSSVPSDDPWIPKFEEKKKCIFEGRGDLSLEKVHKDVREA